MAGRALGSLVVLGAFALLAGSALRHAAAAARPEPLLGVTTQGGARLSVLDPKTLRVRRATTIAATSTGWSFSPDRRRLVVSDGRGRLQIVDTRRLRVLALLASRIGGHVAATAWLGSRVLVVVRRCGARCIYSLVAIDVRTRRVVARRRLAGVVHALARWPGGIALLLGPEKTIGPSRLAVAGPGGAVRSVALDSIPSGSRSEKQQGVQGYPVILFQARPAVAVDSAGRRAFVVAGGAPLAEVDLRTLAVRYHRLSLSTQAAAAPATNGPIRGASWLGRGLLLVWGHDDAGAVDSGGKLQVRQTAAGLELVDTRSWSVRRLDGRVASAVRARSDVLGYALLANSSTGKLGGAGLAGFRLDGARAFHLFGSKPLAEVQAVADRAFVCCPSGSATSYTIVDVETGRVVQAIRGELPTAFTGAAADLG